MALITSHWYYNTESGELTNGNNLENLGNNLLGGLGWHELNIPGSDTQAQAAAAAVKEFPAGKAPTTSLTTGAANEAQNYTGSVLGTLAGFLGVKNISGKNLLVRGAKIVIGGLLFVIGLVHITGADNAVASVARKVPVPI
jgi:hypothetical protein